MVHPGPWTCACFYPQYTRLSEGPHLLSWACQHGPIRGWSARRILLPYFSWCIHHGWLYALLRGFSFTSCNPTPSGFAFSGFLAVSNLDSLSRSPLRSRGSFQFLNVSDVFGGASEMVWWNLRSFPRMPDCLIHQYLISNIFSYSRVASLLRPRYPCVGLVGFSYFVSLGQRGSKIFGGAVLRLIVISGEVFSLPSCFVFM